MNQRVDEDAARAEELLAPGYASRTLQQFFTHAAHAPLTIIILEWLLSGGGYFHDADPYILIISALAQAAWMGNTYNATGVGMLLGNLMGVGLYTLGEGLIEGSEFFDYPQHHVYWLIAGVFAVLQMLRINAKALAEPLLLIENILRAAIPLLFYAVFEARAEHTAIDIDKFLNDSAHRYLTIVVLLLGILLGFADIALRRAQAALRHLAGRLHQLSSWGFGANVVSAALTDASTVALQRQQRAILFMDIRGFTAWSEPQPPEAVVAMLNAFYDAAENCLRPFAPIKIKFTADEVMATFADNAAGLAAARALQSTAAKVLQPYGLTAGGGVHAGPVVEGLLGSAGTKAYDLIGDAANTASRLCSAARPGELLVSESIPLSENFPQREIQAKGKQQPLLVRAIDVYAPAAS